MITEMFSPAAVACLVDGRGPRPDEIAELASKIWHDVYAHDRKIAWSDVDPGSELYITTHAAAIASLGG